MLPALRTLRLPAAVRQRHHDHGQRGPQRSDGQAAARPRRGRHSAHRGHTPSPTGFTSGMHLALWVSGLMLLVGAPIAFRHDPPHGAAATWPRARRSRARQAEPDVTLERRRVRPRRPRCGRDARGRGHGGEPGGGGVCSAEHAGWLATPLRRLLHDPRRVLAGLAGARRDGRRLRLRTGLLHPAAGRDGGSRAAASWPSTCSRPCSSGSASAPSGRACRAHHAATLRDRQRRRAAARRRRAGLLHGPRGARRGAVPGRGRGRAASPAAASCSSSRAATCRRAPSPRPSTWRRRPACGPAADAARPVEPNDAVREA